MLFANNHGNNVRQNNSNGINNNNISANNNGTAPEEQFKNALKKMKNLCERYNVDKKIDGFFASSNNFLKHIKLIKIIKIR